MTLPKIDFSKLKESQPSISAEEFLKENNPVEGDVRAESIELLKKELDAIYEGIVHAPKGMNMPVILIDALLSKYNFTRKG